MEFLFIIVIFLFQAFPLGLKSSPSRSIAEQPSSKQHLQVSKRKAVYDVMQTASKRLSEEARNRKRQQVFVDLIEKELILSYAKTLGESRLKRCTEEWCSSDRAMNVTVPKSSGKSKTTVLEWIKKISKSLWPWRRRKRRKHSLFTNP